MTFLCRTYSLNNYKSHTEAFLRTLSSPSMHELGTNIDSAHRLISCNRLHLSFIPDAQDPKPHRLSVQECGRSTADEKRKFFLLSFADTRHENTIKSDEVTKSNSISMAQFGFDKQTLMDDPSFPVLVCWECKKASPGLIKVAFRVYAIPVSSYNIESLFSSVNTIVKEERALISSKVMQDIVFVHSKYQRNYYTYLHQT